MSNAFNLADDLIEPYRPIADTYIMRHLCNRDMDLPFNIEDRRYLAGLLQYQIIFDGETLSLLNALERTVADLKHALRTKEPKRLRFAEYTPFL